MRAGGDRLSGAAPGVRDLPGELSLVSSVPSRRLEHTWTPSQKLICCDQVSNILIVQQISFTCEVNFSPVFPGHLGVKTW